MLELDNMVAEGVTEEMSATQHKLEDLEEALLSMTVSGVGKEKLELEQLRSRSRVLAEQVWRLRCVVCACVCVW